MIHIGPETGDRSAERERERESFSLLLVSAVARLNGQELRGTRNETLSRRNRGHDVPLYLLSGLQSTGSMTRNGERPRVSQGLPREDGIVSRLPVDTPVRKTYFSVVATFRLWYWRVQYVDCCAIIIS